MDLLSSLRSRSKAASSEVDCCSYSVSNIRLGGWYSSDDDGGDVVCDSMWNLEKDSAGGLEETLPFVILLVKDFSTRSFFEWNVVLDVAVGAADEVPEAVLWTLSSNGLVLFIATGLLLLLLSVFVQLVTPCVSSSLISGFDIASSKGDL